MSNYYHFEECISLLPNQLTFYNEVTRKKINKKTGVSELVHISDGRTRSLSNLSLNKFTGFTLSDSAYRNLRRRITWLYHLAKSRHVKTYSGKDIWSFKMAFITLTLPSQQKHPTSFITQNCLNQFLTEVRQRTKMENYVWRLEFQENGNVHYHLATDTYLDYYFIRDIWNRILKKYGYTQEYTEKHKKLSLSEYVAMNTRSEHDTYEKLAKRYAKGCKEGWENPPSVDVRSVINGKSINFYLSKYFSKDNDGKPVKNDLDDEENSKGLRLWYSSTSLSRLKTLNGYKFEFETDFKSLLGKLEKVRKVFLKYCTVYYFEIKDLAGFARIELEKLLKRHSRESCYRPAT